MNSAKIARKYIISGLAVLLASIIIFLIVDSFASIFRKPGKSENFSQTFESITGLDINLDAGELLITTGDQFKVEGKNIYNGFKYSVDNGTLVIKDDRDFINIITLDKATKLTVYLPESFVAKKAIIDTGAGSVKINSLSSESLNITMGAGKLICNNLKSKSTKIDGGAGEIDIANSSLANLNLNAGVGKTSFSGQLPGDNKIDCGVGELRLRLSGSSDSYNLITETGLGKITINGEEVSNIKWGNITAENSLKVKGGVGSFNITFEK